MVDTKPKSQEDDMSGFKTPRVFALLLSLHIPISVFAATHTIVFGGSAGFAYSPAAVNVRVGDTITWTGNFAVHPLTSTTIPPGAPAWQHATGTDFSYVVTVPGTFNYKCTVHSGMVGSFTATVASVKIRRRVSNLPGWNIRAAVSRGKTRLILNAPESGPVSIQVRSLDGALSGTERRIVAERGSNLVALQGIPAGAHLLVVTRNGKRCAISAIINL